MELHKPTLRVLRILALVDAGAKSGLTLTDISSAIAVPKGTLSPILRTLAELRYLHFNNDNGRYTIGFKSFELGLEYGSNTDLLAMVQQRMMELVNTVGEICQLGILSGLDVFYLLKENPDNAISIRSSVGARIPAYATGLGKALLAGKTNDEIRSLYKGYPFKPYTANTITNVDALIKQVAQVRESGMAHEEEESKDEICCQAVPLVVDDQIKAAISVTVPKFRYTAEKRELITSELQRQKQIIEDVCKVQGYHFDY
ncbi:IclR family transcriptional regulator [Lacticaseibacillus baoqingensis]|uniref:IclR family transcriptional regulator n=1 Tax=Lacticaseibacillus baoqingensis TaxID=2486013 RepID=A0ABW4E9X8_9LACO|nr:IclR family transcriptional regulator [Lacticaseibacillus baoqingensis]